MIYEVLGLIIYVAGCKIFIEKIAPPLYYKYQEWRYDDKKTTS